MLILAWLISGGSRSFPGGRTAPLPCFGILSQSCLLRLLCLPAENGRSPSRTELGHFWSGRGAAGTSSSLLRSPCWSCFGRGRPAFALGLEEARLSPFPQAEVNCDVGCKASVFLSSRRVETLRFRILCKQRMLTRRC